MTVIKLTYRQSSIGDNQRISNSNNNNSNKVDLQTEQHGEKKQQPTKQTNLT